MPKKDADALMLKYARQMLDRGEWDELPSEGIRLIETLSNLAIEEAGTEECVRAAQGFVEIRLAQDRADALFEQVFGDLPVKVKREIKTWLWKKAGELYKAQTGKSFSEPDR